MPATQTLAGESIFVMDETRAVTQDIRPLQILVLNLMPTKIETETQLPRPLGNTPLQVELEFLYTSSHESKNAAKEHLFKFYQVFDQVRDRSDGMARRWSRCRLRTWNPGRSCARSWSGARRTSIPRFTSAGAHRRGSVIISHYGIHEHDLQEMHEQEQQAERI